MQSSTGDFVMSVSQSVCLPIVTFKHLLDSVKSSKMLRMITGAHVYLINNFNTSYTRNKLSLGTLSKKNYLDRETVPKYGRGGSILSL